MPDSTAEIFAEIVGRDNILTDTGDCLTYGYDNSRRQAQPAIVVFPTDAEQVREIVIKCNELKLPLLARGRATATTGATVPVDGAAVISFEKMNRIIRIDTDNRLAIVEPGVTNQELQNALAEKGFFWPPDPTSSAYCTIGGNISCNSAGPKAVKYGTPRENILALKCVTGAGKTIKTGSPTTKGVVGYDLTRLIAGSEGTLAVLTEATLKITPLPEDKITIQAIYDSVQSGAEAVAAVMAQPVTPCALEFIDHNAIEIIRDYSRAELPQSAGAMLMVEVDGSSAQLKYDSDKVIAKLKNSGCLSVDLAQTDEEKSALWATRKALSPALRKISPKKINEDVVVPVANIPQLIEGLDRLSNQYQTKIVNFGHAGNGNIHVNLLLNDKNADEVERAHNCLAEVFKLVLELDGTISGEHGIGLEKRNYVALELSQDEIDLMLAIKRQFDPLNILNPGKIFPEKAKADEQPN